MSPLTRFPLSVSQAWSLTLQCGESATFTGKAVWCILLPTLVDFFVLDSRLSVALLVMHGALLLLTGGSGAAGVCFAPDFHTAIR